MQIRGWFDHKKCTIQLGHEGISCTQASRPGPGCQDAVAVAVAVAEEVAPLLPLETSPTVAEAV